MFSKEFLEMLTEILKSWQVLAVTGVLIIYMFIVSYMARSYHAPRPKKVKVKKSKKADAPVIEAGPEEAGSGAGDSNDELGLEEK
jgi:hypothetical protein